MTTTEFISDVIATLPQFEKESLDYLGSITCYPSEEATADAIHLNNIIDNPEAFEAIFAKFGLTIQSAKLDEVCIQEILTS